MIDLKEKVTERLAALLPGASADEIRTMVEVPGDDSLGDLAFPCFRLAKELRKAPAAIARELAEQLSGDPLYARV